MGKTENNRQFQVLDQMLSMHAALRDKFKRRALLLNLVLLLTSVFLCAFVFADESIFSLFGLEPRVVKFFIGIASLLCFAISLAEYRVDWKGQSALHAYAVKVLFTLKADYREAFDRYTGENEEKNKQLLKQYKYTMDNIVDIPEASFGYLKAKHLRKVLLSKRINECPNAPVVLLKIQLRLSGIFSSFSCNSQKNNSEKS